MILVKNSHEYYFFYFILFLHINCIFYILQWLNNSNLHEAVTLNFITFLKDNLTKCLDFFFKFFRQIYRNKSIWFYFLRLFLLLGQGNQVWACCPSLFLLLTSLKKKKKCPIFSQSGSRRETQHWVAFP